MKRIALPVSGNRLSTHFGHCEHFMFYDIEDQKIIKVEQLKSPPHQPGYLPNWLAGRNITDVITGGIGHKAIEVFNQYKINVFVGVKQSDPNEIVNEYLEGILETNGNLCSH